MLERIAKLLETGHCKMRCFAGNSSQRCGFRCIGNIRSQWGETLADVTGIVSHPGPILCGGLQGSSDEIQTHVDEAVFQNAVESLLDTDKLGRGDQRKEFESMR